MKNKLMFTILTLVTIILIVSTISAANFDNSKKFIKDETTSEYGKIKIDNWFGFGGTLAEYELIYNTNSCGEICSARGTAILYAKEQLFSNIDFLDIKKNNYKVLDYEIYIITYNEKQNQNGSITTEQIKTRYDFKELNAGVYEWEIIGHKEKKETIDWIGSALGNKFNEWALWDGSTEAHGVSFDTSETTNTATSGMRIMTGGDALKVSSITKDGSSTATHARVLNAGKGTIASATFVGNVATFDPVVDLSVETTYYLGVDKAGAVFTSRFKSSGVTYNYTGTLINWTGGMSTIGGDSSTAALNVVSATFVTSSVSLVAPVNGFGSNSNTIEFNCSADTVSGVTIENISLMNNESGTLEIVNSTTGLSSQFENVLMNYTFAGDGSYLWSCRACDSDGDCGQNGGNRTVIIDATPPVLNITNPNTLVNYHSIGTNLTFNWTASDSNIQACKLEYSGTNYTVPCDAKNLSLIINSYSNRTARLWANDTSGNTATFTRTWNYNIFENSQSYQNSTTEGATETFTLNITKAGSVQVSTIVLNYNSTNYPATYVLTGNEAIATSTITIPTKDATISVPFYWDILLTNGNRYNSTNASQTIEIINIGNCTTFGFLLYNYTVYDEETQAKLNNATIEIQLALYNPAKTTQFLNFSQSFTGTHSATICSNTSLLNTVNYSVDSVVKYSANESTGGNNSNNYAKEYYNILGQVVSNLTIPKHISLYDLKTADSSEFQLTFKDANLNLAPNVLVYLYRQYVADNNFKIVEVPLTDSNGQTVLHMVRNDVVYNLVMVNSAGTILATFNKVIAFCQDYTIGQCTINLNAPSTSSSLYNYTADLSISYTKPTFSNTTNLISFNYVSTNLSTVTVRTDVIKNSGFGNRTICTNSITSSTGTLTCDISSSVNTDRFLFIEIYVGDDLKSVETIDLEGDTSGFGIVAGAFYAFLFLLLLITMFSDDRQTLIISLMLGWVFIISIGLIKGTLFGTLSGGIWLMICLIIFLWKLNKEDRI